MHYPGMWKIGQMIFGFSLYTMPLLAILVTYFRTELGELNGWKTIERCQDVLLPIPKMSVSFS